MRYRKLLLISILTFMVGCSGVQTIERQPLPELKFNRTPAYEIDLSTIDKPTPIKPIYAYRDDNGIIKESDIDNANVVILTQEEYKKVAQLVLLASSYKKVIEQQEVLVNNQIDINNSLKEFVELERLKSQQYQEMWVDSENAYLQEKKDHKTDNVIGKIVEMILTGAVIALAI